MRNVRQLLLGAAIVAALGSLPIPSLADYQPTAEQRAACTGDAFRLCSSDIPNMSRIIACMQAKKSQLSPRCRAQFDKG